MITGNSSIRDLTSCAFAKDPMRHNNHEPRLDHALPVSLLALMWMHILPRRARLAVIVVLLCFGTSHASAAEFRDAVAADDVVTVKAFLQDSPGLATVQYDDSSGTPLHVAARAGSRRVAELLLDRGAKLDAPAGSLGETPLSCACAFGRKEMVDLLFAKGLTNKSRVNANGASPLHVAAANGQQQVAELLIAGGAEVDAPDDYGWRPLHCAAHRGHAGMVKFLLEKKARIDSRTEDGATPLHAAVDSRYFRLVSERIRRDKRREYTFEATFLLLDDSRAQVVSALLERKPDVRARDNEGISPLHLAAQSGHMSTVRLLLKAGADAGAKDKQGQVPMADPYRGAFIPKPIRITRTNWPHDLGSAGAAHKAADSSEDTNVRKEIDALIRSYAK